jgi:hypothetical protein
MDACRAWPVAAAGPRRPLDGIDGSANRLLDQGGGAMTAAA